MVVKIEEIQKAGLEFSEAIAPAMLAEALTDAEGFKLKSASKFHASFKRVSGRVLMTGSFDVTVVAPCKRCVDEVEVTVPVRFELNLVPKAPRRRDEDENEDERADSNDGESAGTFQLTDVETETFDGKTIDLDPIIREQVLLALPVSVLCREDCKGLCTICGQELNVRECGCEQKVVDPRLLVLKDIKLN